jgi:hypothetical protein
MMTSEHAGKADGTIVHANVHKWTIPAFELGACKAISMNRLIISTYIFQSQLESPYSLGMGRDIMTPLCV